MLIPTRRSGSYFLALPGLSNCRVSHQTIVVAPSAKSDISRLNRLTEQTVAVQGGPWQDIVARLRTSSCRTRAQSTYGSVGSRGLRRAKVTNCECCYGSRLTDMLCSKWLPAVGLGVTVSGSEGLTTMRATLRSLTLRLSRSTGRS